MATYVVGGGKKRVPTPDEWESVLGNKIPEFIRQFKAGNLDPYGVEFTFQTMIEGNAIQFSPPEPKIQSWREENGVIYFTVTSDGTSGKGWIKRLGKKGFVVEPKYAKSVLLSSDFKPTRGVTYEVAVLKGMLFVADSGRITVGIRAAAYSGTFTKGQKLSDPNAEVACLIREKFSDEEIEVMGLWGIVAMHQPIKDSGGVLNLLGAYRRGGGHGLSAFCGIPAYRWDRENGFAFVVSQVSA